MKLPSLAEYFSGFGFKKLSATEVDPETSHGHEFQGISVFRDLFGQGRMRFKTTFIHLGSQHEDGYLAEAGEMTWYNSRENQPQRSAEYRLYYDVDLVQSWARAGDLCVIARGPAEDVTVMIAEADSTFEHQLMWLFRIKEDTVGERFSLGEVSAGERLDFAARSILESLGFELREDASDYLDSLLRKFGPRFPSTREFSDFARNTVPEVDASQDADKAFLIWIEREELLFRTLERYLVSERLRSGFGEKGDDVDEFVQFSLSVHNRRKSRVGHALENHLVAVFTTHGIRFTKNGVTENRSKPDFVFPDIASYHNLSFPEEYLTVLGVKSTCKDRWRQVLAEANRVKNKHLFTLEPGISEFQTAEMASSGLQLIVPTEIHVTYTPAQQKQLLSLTDLIGLLKRRQSS